MRSFVSGSALVLAVSFCFAGCSDESEQTGKTVIDPSAAPAPSLAPTTGANGIPSSGRPIKKKPDPVGAMSPIIPR